MFKSLAIEVILRLNQISLKDPQRWQADQLPLWVLVLPLFWLAC